MFNCIPPLYGEGVLMVSAHSRRRRPGRLVFAGLLVLAGGAAPAQEPPAPPAVEQTDGTQPATGPRIEVEQHTVDLGQIVRGETAEARFAFHNRGDETLRILRAKPG
jgi:hypothetical protein